MADALKLAGGIVLILALALIGVTVLLLSIRAGVEIVGANGQIAVELRYGVLRIPIFPLSKKKKEKPVESAPPAQPTPKPKKSRWKFQYKNLDIGEIWDFLFSICSELSDTIRFSHVRVRVLVGTDDAAKTGLFVGYASAFVGMAIPFFENTFDMRDYHINIDADFDASHTIWACQIRCTTRPIQALRVVLRYGKRLFQLYKKLLRKDEVITNERKSYQPVNDGNDGEN